MVLSPTYYDADRVERRRQTERIGRQRAADRIADNLVKLAESGMVTTREVLAMAALDGMEWAR